MMKSEEKQLVKFDKLLLIENELAKTKVWKFFKCLIILALAFLVDIYLPLKKNEKKKQKYIYQQSLIL